MKRRLQKILLLTVMSVCFFLLGVNVHAEEKQKSDVYVYVNPLYKNITAETEICEESSSDANVFAAPKLNQARNTYYSEMSRLARDARSAMKNREKVAELHFKQKGLLADQWFDDLLEEALKETDDSKEGDYIRWNLQGCEISYTYYTYDAELPSETTQNYFDIVIKFTYLTTEEQENELDDMVKKVLEDLNVYNLSYSEKIEVIYDYICDNITYDFENLENESELLKYTAYGALKNKKAVCQGYASLFYCLARRSGVSVRIIGGTSYGMPHAWNIVKLEDAYYNIDATWDAGVNPREYFLKGSADFNKDHLADAEYLTESFLQEYPISEMDYSGPSIVDSGICGENLTWTYDGEDILHISGTGDMYNWEVLNDVPWAKYRTRIKGVVFDEGITSIGNKAFCDCSVFSVTPVFPETLVKIGERAFYFCTNLGGELKLPSNLTELGQYAFYNTEITKVVFPENMKEIPAHAFENTNLKEIVLPGTLEVIGDSAFAYCSFMAGALNLPDTLTYIGEKAFYECNGLTGDLIIPEGIQSISKGAFARCRRLDGELLIPETVTYIGSEAFEGCSNLKGELKLPSNLTSIGQNAFASCSGFTGELKLPENITVIESSAFERCSGFTGALKIPAGVTTIESRAFWICTGFNGTLEIPESVTSIESEAFASCRNLTGELNLPSGLQSMGYGAFDNCSGFTGALVIPETLTKIERSTFNNCGGFTGALVIPANVTKVDTYAFLGVNNISHVTVMNSSCSIDSLPLNATIIAEPGSKAHDYAEKNNRKFQCLEHKWTEEKTVDVKPTCKTEGIKSYHCIGCNIIKEGSKETIPTTVHDYKWVTEKRATTTQEGRKYQICSWCEGKTNITTIGIPKAELKMNKFVFYGEMIEPEVQITDSEGEVLQNGTDYKLSGTLHAASVGKYSCKVTYYGDYSGTKTLSYTVVPAKVQDFKAQLSGGHNDVKLTWDKSDGATRYYVSYKKSSATKYSSAKWTTKTSYTFKDLAAGTAYDFRVIPYYVKDDNKYYADSEYAYISFKTLKNVKAPSKVTASLYAEYNDVNVKWNKSTGAAGYNVYYKEGSSDEYIYLTSTTKTSTKEAKNLKDGVKYTFKVVPYYKDGGEKVESYYSKTGSVYTLKQLDIPKVTKSSSKVKVQWNNISGESGYQISKSTSEDGTSIVTTYSTTSGKSKTISATKGKTYYYKVRAYKTVDGKKIPGPWSEVVKYTRK